jgi:cytochrome c553
MTGGGKTTACVACHGADLKGIGPIPNIASRSPSYIGRQLGDYRAGFRKGAMAAMMSPVAAALNDDDMLNISAYLASIPVAAPPPMRRAANGG